MNCPTRNSVLLRRIALALPLLVATSAGAGTTERVSVSSSGVEGDADASYFPAISADGRYVAFSSNASNLVPSDFSGNWDVFVRDRKTDVTTRVSVGMFGLESNGYSSTPSISNDGRFIAYGSLATNLVPGDTNNQEDLFRFDRATGITTRLSLTAAGAEPDGDCSFPTLSADGRYVAFQSDATNLVANDTNGLYDVFVKDLLLGTVERVSHGPGGGDGDGWSASAVISTDGRFVTFSGYATNLVGNDGNGALDVFRHDLQTGATELVSVSLGGGSGSGDSQAGAWAAMSADGRFVAFDSTANDLIAGDTNGYADIFVRDMLLGVTTRVSTSAGGAEGDNASHIPAISADGRYVTCFSDASNLVANDVNGARDCFRFDRVTGAVLCISFNTAGVSGNGASVTPTPSADGRHVVFTSQASDLVPGDSNALRDLFVFSDSWVTFKSYGAGLAGSGDFVPALSGTNGSAAAGGHALHLDGVLGGATGILFIGLAPASTPFLGGQLLVSVAGPVFLVTLPVSGPAGLPGFGAFDLPGADVTSAVGLKLFLQYLASDANAVFGVSMSNGLELDVVP